MTENESLQKNRISFKDLFLFLVVAILAYAIVSFSFDKSRIMSASMEPTLMTGDTVIYINDFFTGVDRGDIVEFETDGQIFSKRVIGIGGDHISFEDGYVVINGKKADSDEYTLIPASTFPGNSTEYNVPEECFFVMGDNREDSFDSRFWTEPFVKKEDVKGKYLFTLSRAK